ncbi:hypothetical protein [Rhizosphaericola mali]|uniref:Uncharacterized protein n=1 Tax=Rhizosphaericola mali TaxID=2545455 RepID=A0A5P2G4T9_9BACT|nr:hypothetical protein [Rhizosphaericola mali]QES90844.1 hypothetical protein E0W69_020065 [Rhizosphaericola mali]
MRKLILVIYGCLALQLSHAQKMDSVHISKMEDSLKTVANDMIFNKDLEQRMQSNQKFVRSLVKVLEKPYSYQYKFDSLQTISIEYAPDNAFRIFTWELELNDNYFRQFGAIQMNTKDGKMKIFPLFDASEFTEMPWDSVRDAKHWIGALYYKILKNSYKGKDYYTLLGLDDHDFLTTRKWIDVLTFDKNEAPQFGAPIFQYKYDTIKVQPPVDRFLFEFKKDGRARLNYDPELNLIVFDHLISEKNRPWDKMTLVSNGEYEGFQWKEGKWVHIPNIFANQKNNPNTLPKPKNDSEFDLR